MLIEGKYILSAVEGTVKGKLQKRKSTELLPIIVLPKLQARLSTAPWRRAEHST